MNCPYCHKPLTEVVNTRATRGNSQIWRRRKCLNCNQTFTTHEVIDLSHLIVIKKSGKQEFFSRIKLYSGIYGASIGFKTEHREKLVDKITREVEKKLLSLKRKRITSEEISDLVLFKLRSAHTATFLRFLAYNKDIKSESQMKKELAKYLEGI